MPETRRVQVTGDLFHPQLPAGAAWCGRAQPYLPWSPWANPHRIGKSCSECDGQVHTREESLALYQGELATHPRLVERARAELAGRDLACRCGLDEACHVDLLIAAMADGR